LEARVASRVSREKLRGSDCAIKGATKRVGNWQLRQRESVVELKHAARLFWVRLEPQRWCCPESGAWCEIWARLIRLALRPQDRAARGTTGATWEQMAWLFPSLG